MIVATDIACWLPIIVFTYASYFGLEIPDIVTPLSSIVLLPINSFVNPFLYSRVEVILYDMFKYCVQKTHVHVIIKNIIRKVKNLRCTTFRTRKIQAPLINNRTFQLSTTKTQQLTFGRFKFGQLKIRQVQVPNLSSEFDKLKFRQFKFGKFKFRKTKLGQLKFLQFKIELLKRDYKN